MDSQTITSKSGEVYTVPDDTLEIHVLWPPDGQAGAIKADIVAVHGLGGDSFGTWTEDSTKELWLRTFLPKDIENVRIMTFGYNANIFRDKAAGNMYSFAENLLAALRRKRTGEAVFICSFFSPYIKSTPLHTTSYNAQRRRPLILLGHSLGGIVIKQALITANMRPHMYKDILESTWHLMFFGTPHQGSLFATGADFLNKLASVFSGNTTRVSKESFFQDKFLGAETNQEIVHEGSARLGHKNEEVIGLNADHLSICKFANRSNASYITVKDILIQELMRLDENEAVEEHENHIQELAENLRLLFSMCLKRMSNKQYQLHEMKLFMLLIRFKAWGQACCLDSPQFRIQELDDPNSRVAVGNALMRIVKLLMDTDKLQSRGNQNSPEMMVSSTNNNAIHQRLRNFLKGPAERTNLHTTHPYKERLSELFGELGNCIDEMESITNTPAIADRQHSIIEKEVESISDLSMLEQLEAIRSVMNDTVSDVASIRLKRLRGQADIDSSSISPGPSFQTPQSQLPPPVNEANFQELESEFQDMAIGRRAGNLDALSSSDHAQRTNWNAGESASQVVPQWTTNSKTAQYGSKLKSIQNANGILCHKQFSIPANIRASVTSWNPKDKDIKSRKRLLLELQQFIYDCVEGISISPIADNIYHFSACIEGPPDTPYEEGIFWIDVQIPEDYPWRPPKMRFVTKVYHPNIDSRGKICVDFLEDELWPPTYSLKSALISIVSLLGHPTLEDVQEPLVPEIAQTYLEDHELYCQNARKYTQMYAKNLAPP